MAKASPEELAMHKTAETDVDAALKEQLENPTQPVVEKADETPAPGEAPKAKRGRPSNAEKALKETLEKETVGDDGAKANVGAKPGRKPGSGKSGIDATALGNQLVGIHALAAMITGIPECQIQPQEGTALAEAVVAVCQEYNLSLSGKTGAGIQLFAAAAMIYMPRVLHYKSRVSQAQQIEVPQNANTQFTPAG